MISTLKDCFIYGEFVYNILTNQKQVSDEILVASITTKDYPYLERYYTSEDKNFKYYIFNNLKIKFHKRTFINETELLINFSNKNFAVSFDGRQVLMHPLCHSYLAGYCEDK